MHTYLSKLTIFLLLSFLLSANALANEIQGKAEKLSDETRKDAAGAEKQANNEQIVEQYNNTQSNQNDNEGQRYEFCGELGWLNNNYCYLNYGVDATAITINNWFKHEGGDNLTPAATKGRLRFGWEPRSGDFSELDFRFRIRVKLPALEDRVELLLSDDEDDVRQQAVKAARSSQLRGRDQTVLAVQFKNSATDKLSYRVGFGRGSQLYTRARFSDQHRFTGASSLRYFAETNYYSGDKLGFEANAEYGFVFDSSSTFELGNSFRFRNKSSDWIWRHEFRYLRLGDDDTSYLFTASVNGASKPSYRKQQMFVSLRYKRKILREWLFLEIEPFVLWLREEDFRASPGIAIRTEIHFST
jgi:hypothetical protein